MRRHILRLLVCTLVVFLTPAAALCAKYENKDTARDRQDYTMGTRPKEEGSTIILGRDPESGDTVMQSIPREREERDWYENMFMYINIDKDAPSEDVPDKPQSSPADGDTPDTP